MGNSTLPLGGADSRRISENIVQTAHGFTSGQVVRHNGTLFVLAQADTPANAESVGVIESFSVNEFFLVYQGKIDISALGPPFTTPDQVLFLSDTTPGGLSITPPSTAGTVIKPMLLTTDGMDGVVTGYNGTQIGGANVVSLNNIQPLGAIQPWAAPAGAPLPDGWMLCDGNDISRTVFLDLFNLIGTTYGVGDGSTTFNLPDLRRRVPVGEEPLSGDRDAGDFGGEEEHTLLSTEIPPHTHTFDTVATFVAPPGPPYVALTLPPSGPGPGPSLAGSTEYGPGDPHNNMQPFLVINFIIRVVKRSNVALFDHLLGDHGDVNIPSPVADNVFQYNGTQWENRADLQLADPNAVYFGDANTDGTWRIVRSGFDLVIELRELGFYVTKTTITP